MKIISILLSFLLINSLGLVVGDGSPVLVKCQAETGASNDEVQAIVDKKMPTTQKGRCMMACIYESAGIIQDGKFVVANLNKVIGTGNKSAGGKLAEKFVEEVANDCKALHNDDKCLLAIEIINCAADSIARHAQKQEL